MIFTFWYVKGNIPNEKIRLPPLEVHFGIGGCGRTVSAGGLVKNKMKGGSLNKITKYIFFWFGIKGLTKGL